MSPRELDRLRSLLGLIYLWNVRIDARVATLHAG